MEVSPAKPDNNTPEKSVSLAYVQKQKATANDRHSRYHFTASLMFVWRLTVRSLKKNAITASVTVIVVIAIGVLISYVKATDSEIDRLYDSIVVNGEVRPHDGNPSSFAHHAGNLIGPQAVNGIMETGYTADAYIEAAYEWTIIMLTDDESQRDDWERISGYDSNLNYIDNYSSFSALVATSDLEEFASRHSRGAIDEIPGIARRFADGSPIADFRVEYAMGNDITSFEHVQNSPVPIILPESSVVANDPESGSMALIIVFSINRNNNKAELQGTMQAQVIGVHNRNIIGSGLRDAAILPLSALESLTGDDIGYTSFMFSIDTSYNKVLQAVHEDFRAILLPARWVPLTYKLWDEELRIVVGSLERNMALLNMLFPVAIVAAAIIGFLISLLMLMQHAKTSAIMRSLGVTKIKVVSLLFAELFSVSAMGYVLALAILLFIRLSAATIDVVLHSSFYILGVVAGSLTGAIVISGRSPLSLLQVRE